MFEIDNLVRKNIRLLTAYSSARKEFKGDGILLDANENPFGEYNRYPDPLQTTLKKEIGRIKGVNLENIFLGNGSDEIIDLLFRIFCKPEKDKVISFSPSYGMYRVSANINDVELIDIPLTNDFQIDTELIEPFLFQESIKLLFICSPNNPTGNSFHERDILYLLKKFKGIVVVDEAYIDFSLRDSMAKEIDEFPNLVVLQTLSKARGLAGLRLGMAFAHKSIITYLNKVKPPYNISSVNQKVALDVLRNEEHFENNKKLILAEKSRLEKELKYIDFIENIYPSDANFILIKVVDADHLYDQLKERNIIVRNRSQLINNCLRITIGSPEENKLLLNELKALSDAKSTIS